ncbi:DUF4262 domain-containing protein [Pedococcus sp. 5OH_020]|uniref:DUF4262 domain-containing protein n=1 Tax=Pedococcus sp. 5OH_020 TaxID=2989814 RepID=UPI0022EA0B7B|nr:DUF4262 domain-containing protein [Pedococcus sp. 5OH_020]
MTNSSDLLVDAFRRPDPKELNQVEPEEPQEHPVTGQMAWCYGHFGFTVADFGGDSLANYCVYTVGLIQFNHHELIIIGVPPEAARMVLFGLGHRVVHEHRYIHASPHSYDVEAYSDRVDEGTPRIRLVELTTQEEHRLFGGGLYRHHYDAYDPPETLLRVTFEDPRDLSPMPFAPSALFDPGVGAGDDPDPTVPGTPR